MRVTLGFVVAAGLSAVLLSACGNQAAVAEATPAAPQGELVRAVGVCPTPGAQAGCLTVTAKGQVYDVTGAVDVSRGVAVSLKGRDNGEAGACGKKLAELAVEYTGIQCATAPDPETLGQAAPAKPAG